MGASGYEYLLGERTKFFVKTETTFGTYIAVAATDAMAIKKATISPKTSRKDRLDAYQPTRDVVERITGKNEYKWSVDAYYVPSGTKNVAPNCGPFLKALLGTETVNANDVTYSQSSSQTLNTLTIAAQRDTYFQEILSGCWVDSMSFKCSGGGEPEIHFEGGAMGYVPTGHSLTTVALSGGETTVTYTATDDNAFSAGSVIAIGTDTARTVSSVDSATHTITFAPAATAQSKGVAILPYVPTWTDAGVPTTGISGSLTWDSADISALVTGFELAVKSNAKSNADAAFQASPTDAWPSFFEITGKIDLRIRKDRLIKVLDRKAFTTKALAVVVGGAAQSGTRAEITAGYCELDFSDVEVPEQGEATISLPFKAIDTTGANAALSWKHT